MDITEEVEEIRPVGIIERDGCMWLHRKSRREPVKASNFVVRAIGTYDSDEVGESGRIFRVVTEAKVAQNTWEAAITYTDQATGDSAIELLNRNKILMFRSDIARFYLPQYFLEKAEEYENGGNHRDYLLIEFTGWHELPDSRFVFIGTQKDGSLLKLYEDGMEAHDQHVFIKRKAKLSAYEVLQETDERILQPMFTVLFASPVNRAPSILAAAWFLNRTAGYCDGGLNIMLNVFGQGSSGKTTMARILSRSVGRGNAVKLYSPAMIMAQCSRTTLPTICNDPPPEAKWFSELHSYTASIADKQERSTAQSTTAPVGAVGIVSNFSDWQFDVHNSQISRSINLKMTMPSISIKHKYSKGLHDLETRMENTTAIKEMITLRWEYKHGEKSAHFSDLCAPLQEKFRNVFDNCVSRTEETYFPILQYAVMILDHIDKLELLDCVWQYLEEIAPMHRQADIQDLLKSLTQTFPLNFQNVMESDKLQPSSMRDAAIDKLHLSNHKDPNCRIQYNSEKINQMHPDCSINTMRAEETFVWLSRYKKILCAMPKTNHLFFLYRLILRRNSYTKWKLEAGKNVLLPKARSAMTT